MGQTVSTDSWDAISKRPFLYSLLHYGLKLYKVDVELDDNEEYDDHGFPVDLRNNKVKRIYGVIPLVLTAWNDSGRTTLGDGLKLMYDLTHETIRMFENNAELSKSELVGDYANNIEASFIVLGR